ncbi:MAG: dienelactone hydrolase family protein [Actinobacteria bacterium]|nr:dienelactone hydrolase family protein [Actinomycetota bacterium]
MRASTVDIVTADGVADAYLARPDDGRPYPGVLFIMDAYGLRPAIEEMVGRIAAGGYVVLAPNVLYRSGRAPVLDLPDLTDADRRAAFFQSLRPLLDELTPARIASDGAAYLDSLQERGAPGPVAITGYCMGARVGLRVAAAHPDRVAALAGFHAGGLVTDAPDSPHLIAGDLEAELYFGFADQDPSMSADQIATFERALDEAGVTFRTDVYEGARHGYTMADTPAYDEPSRERHFRELDALLKRALPR